METPPSRRSQSSSSSAAPAETLPPVMLPSSLAEERRTELEAENIMMTNCAGTHTSDQGVTRRTVLVWTSGVTRRTLCVKLT